MAYAGSTPQERPGAWILLVGTQLSATDLVGTSLLLTFGLNHPCPRHQNPILILSLLWTAWKFVLQPLLVPLLTL